MDNFFGLTLLVFREFITHLFGSYIFWVVVLFIAMQYRKVDKNRQKIWGGGDGKFLLNTGVAAVYGIAGGLVGSALLIATGVRARIRRHRIGTYTGGKDAVSVKPGEPIGVIIVPDGNEQVYTELKITESLFRWIVRKKIGS